MKKLLIIGIIGAVALVAIGKKTNAFSYASTLMSSVSADAKNQIPTKFELERIRNEIAALDDDIARMTHPIAEYKVVIKKMQKEIVVSNEKIAAQKSVLLEVVSDLRSGKKELEYGGKRWPADRVRSQLEKDTEGLKRLESHVRTQKNILDAKEQALRATQDQLTKVISMKRDFEIELARLEAAEETLQIATIGSTVKIDNSRATQIKDALEAIDHRQQVQAEQAALHNSQVVTIPLNDRSKASPVDLQTMRNYLEGTEPADKTVSNR